MKARSVSKTWEACGADHCGLVLKHGRNMYRCEACKAARCPACAGRQAKRKPAHELPIIERGDDEQNEEKEQEKLEAPGLALQPATASLEDEGKGVQH